MKTKTTVKPQPQRGFFGDYDNPLVGKYFHAIKDGKLTWQGQVIGVTSTVYMVELFSFLDGSRNVQRLMPICGMHEWLFYPDAETFQFSAEHGAARHFFDELKNA
jgi:hypothetical protein